jgi:hypothetical protein
MDYCEMICEMLQTKVAVQRDNSLLLHCINLQRFISKSDRPTVLSVIVSHSQTIMT